MNRLAAMEVFVRVADEGSFAATARALAISPPSVTRAIASLEEHLGAQLLKRTTRRLALTEVGRRYLEDCRRILAQLEIADAAASGALVRPTGTLHVTAPVVFGQRHVLPVLGRFLDRHPAVRGRALFLDRIVHLIDEGMDVAVRIGHLPDSSLLATRIGIVRHVLVASPSYLSEHGPPEDPQDIFHHDVVAVTRSPAPTVKWNFARNQTVTLRPRVCCNTIDSGLHAATSGWGLTRLLSYQVHEAVTQGGLVRLLPDHELAPVPVHLVHPGTRHTSAKVRAFVDFASPALSKRLSQIDSAFVRVDGAQSTSRSD